MTAARTMAGWARRGRVSGVVLAGALAATCARPETLVTHRRLLAGFGHGRSPAPPLPSLRLGEETEAEIRQYTVHGDGRPSVVLKAPGSFRFQTTVPPGGRMEFGLAIRPVEAQVRVRLKRPGAEGGPLYEEAFQQVRPWSDRKVDLRSLQGRTVELEVSAEGPPGATVAVGDPQVVGRPAEPGPNVIVYVVDCLRADHVGAYGYPRGTTPEIDKLARDSVLFDKAYSCAAWTKPSVGCLLTSLYPMSHGARTVDDSLRDDVTTVAQAFQAAGYSTNAWIANPVVDGPTFHFNRGFDRFVELAHTMKGTNVSAVSKDAAEITADVVPWLKENRDRRFFLYLHSLDLHFPYNPHPPFAERLARPGASLLEHQKDLYDNEIAYNDAEIGKLVAALKDLGVYDRTLLLVTGDHGEEFGEHDRDRHGHTIFDTLLHVPWILKLAASEHRGLHVEAPVSNLDMAPTLLDFSGLRPPEAFQGLSARAAVTAGLDPARYRIFADHMSPRETLYGARDRRFKAIVQLVPEPHEYLFDLRGDPGEQHNLLPSRPADAQGVLRDLMVFMEAALGGYHVVLPGGPAGAPVEVEAWTEGVFVEATRLVIRTGDALAVDAGRQHVTYRFAPEDLGRHLILRTQPPGVALRVRISQGGQPLSPARVGVGRDLRPPPGMPFALDPASGCVPVTELARVLGHVSGIQAWCVAAPAASREAPSAELEEKLKALGYVQ